MSMIISHPHTTTVAPHTATTTRAPLHGLTRAALLYCVLEIAAAWGWMHWRADVGALAPSALVTAVLRSVFLLLFASAVGDAFTRTNDPRARVAAATGFAALVLHLPWTLIVLDFAPFSLAWLFLMTFTTTYAAAQLGRADPRASLIAAPYTAWMVAATCVEALSGFSKL